MNRSVKGHAAHPSVDNVNIIAIGRPVPSGVCNRYRVEPIARDHPQGAINSCDIHFQDGPVELAGVNGITMESLLAVVIDRLEMFQAGPGRCRENAIAVTKLEEAMHWLHHRTRDRIERRVEGTERP